MSLKNLLKSTMLTAGLALSACGGEEALEKETCSTQGIIYGPFPARELKGDYGKIFPQIKFHDIILAEPNIRGVFKGERFWLDACESDADQFRYDVGDQIGTLGGFHAGSNSCRTSYQFDVPGQYPVVVSTWKTECPESKAMIPYVILVGDHDER